MQIDVWNDGWFMNPDAKPVWTEVRHIGLLPPDSVTFHEYHLVGWEIHDEGEENDKG